MAGEVVPERLGRGTSFENGSVSASPLQAVSGGSQKFSFMIFFHPFPSPSSLGGWFFDGTYSFAFTESACRILPGNDVELQKHLQASRNRLGKILKVSWKQWSVGGLELLMWLKESSCGYGCLG